MFRSIQWKLVSIYILLILLAMEVVGGFLLQSMERYHIDNLSNSMEGKAQLISNFIERHMYPVPRYQEINNLIQGFTGSDSEIMYIVILDADANVISTTDIEEEKFQQGVKLLTPETTKAALGEYARDIRQDSATKKRFMHMAYPVLNGNKVVGIIYLISSMENIYATIGDIKTILFMATVIAMVITGFLGYALSKTITGPIQEVTQKAALMAKGDFDHKIPVKSDDEIGKLTKMFNFLTTRLKETLEQISDEKEKIEAILLNMADGVIALNSRGEIIHINPAARQMLLLNNKHIDNEFLQSLLKVNFENYLNEKPEDKEILIKTNNAILKSIIAPLKREDLVVGLIIVLQDITKQHKLDDMRKEFVANVSHELRTPLTTIKSYTETLLDGALTEHELAESFLNVVNNEADRMTRLVSDLLELSRLDNRETRWEKSPISLEMVLKDVIDKMAVNARKKKQELRYDLPDGISKVYADRDKIEQVFQNIMSNAIKYTPEGGSIYVYLKQDGKYIKVVFRDSGIGIPKEDLSRIFERFYRVDKTRSRQMGGTGLGLSIAKEIINAHNGEILIQSTPGHGTEVSILLPAIDEIA
ncbi:MAG TPA: cell wall metabolism sensor histidine kinase WalK [Thermoanaerobacterales bacterium]|jgi:two-component system sensor histidine kinase VicK|nr:cell wall metabolism sensor histidine kinase WalK [Thermoanaerobacterales bacterium]